MNKFDQMKYELSKWDIGSMDIGSMHHVFDMSDKDIRLQEESVRLGGLYIPSRSLEISHVDIINGQIGGLIDGLKFTMEYATYTEQGKKFKECAESRSEYGYTGRQLAEDFESIQEFDEYQDKEVEGDKYYYHCSTCGRYYNPYEYHSENDCCIFCDEDPTSGAIELERNGGHEIYEFLDDEE